MTEEIQTQQSPQLPKQHQNRTDSSFMYVWGRGGDGQLGYGETNDLPLPTQIRSISQRVVSVACGGKHTVVCTANGDVYTWGWNSSGQLGHGDLSDHQVPCVVKALALVKVLQKKRFVQVSAGNDHTIALTESGAVYTWGGGQTGQLGTGGTDHQLIPRLVLALHSHKIIRVSCGSGHTVCLTSDGIAFAWGRSANGRLGLGQSVSDSVLTPTRIKGGLSKLKISEIVCGWSHTLCLAGENSALYSWGKGQDGQLGHGDELDQFEPKIIDFFIKENIRIARLAGGYFHSAAISEDLRLFTWGYGEYGQLGHLGQTKNELIPRIVESLSHLPIIHVSCGGAHTLASDENGILYAFGSGNYGQLGLNSETIGKLTKQTPAQLQLSSSSPLGIALPVPPTQVQSLNGKSVILTACGYWHSVAVIENTTQSNNSNSNNNSFILPPSTTTTTTNSENVSSPSLRSSEISTNINIPPPPTSPISLPDRNIEEEQDISPISSPSTSPLRTSFDQSKTSTSTTATSPNLTATKIGQPTTNLSDSENGCLNSSSLLPARQRTVSVPTRRLISPALTLDSQSDQNKGLFSRIFNIFSGQNKTESFSLKDEQKYEASEMVWIKEVVPKWETSFRKSSKAITMFRKGVPPRVRGIVWKTAIGNSIGMTRELYAIYARHARVEMDRNNDQGTARLIEVDLPRTFPSLLFFNSTGPFYSQLMEVLAAWAQYRPDIGYVQGMSHIAGMLVMHMDTYDAFSCFVNLMETQMVFMSFFKMELDLIVRHLKVYDLMFSENMPDLFEHFTKLEISPNYYLLDWFMTMFTHVLTIPLASRVWDCFLVEHEVFLHRTALGLLYMNRHLLISSQFEKIVDFLRHIPQNFSEDELIAAILSIRVPSYLPSVLKRLHFTNSKK